MTYSAVVLADSPKNFFRLGDASGTTMTDSSGNGNNGTYHNSPTLGVTGLLSGDADTAVTFAAASSQYGDVNSQTVGGGSTFTLEAWIKGASIPTNAHVIEDGRSSNINPIARIYIDASGHAVFYQRDNSATSVTVTGTVNVNDGNRHHLVGVKNGTSYTLYVDGAVDGTATATLGTTTLDRTTIGAADHNGTINQFFTGTIDEGATYTTALSAARVTAHYNEGIGTQSLAAPLLTATPTFYSPAVTLSTQNVVVPLLTNTATLYSPSITPPTPPSQNVVPPRLSAAPTLYTPSVGQVTTPTGASPALYVVKIVDSTGLNPTTLASAQPEDITWTLNEPTEATITWPKPAYTQAQIPTLGTASGAREIQIYRDDDLLFFGPMIQPDTAGSRGEVTGHCADPLWIMNRICIDAPQTSLLNNGSFESAFTSWSHVGSFTATTDSTRKVLGTQSAKFVNATADEDAYKRQDFTVGPNRVGVLITVVAWCYIESLTANAFGSRGLYIEGGQNHTVQDYNYRAIDFQDETLPHNVWIPPEGLQGAQGFTTTLWVPPNQIWDCNVRLYAPQGTIWWDAVLSVEMDSIGSGQVGGNVSGEADIASIARVLVAAVQNSGMGKAYLYVGRNCSLNGVTMVRQYQFADHVNFAEAISEFTGRDDGYDISIEITPTTRTFTTWTPKKGTDRSGSITLTYGGNVADYRWSRDGPGCITDATETGDGSGVARQEGHYADTSQIGGIVLQEVRQAPPETQINSLVPLATERVNQRRTPPLILELDIRPSANLIHTLKVGDWVTVAVSDGYAVASGKHRIVKMKLTCRTNVLTVFLNEDN